MFKQPNAIKDILDYLKKEFEWKEERPYFLQDIHHNSDFVESLGIRSLIFARSIYPEKTKVVAPIIFVPKGEELP